MILTCEQCETRYLVASSAIGESGRKVRCTKCGHEWFQEDQQIDAGFFDEDDDSTDAGDVIDADALESEPAEEADELEESEDDEEIEPIPEAVKPLSDKDGESNTARFDPRLMGYAAGVLIFVLSLLMLVVFKKPVMTAWPPVIGVYDLVGLAPDLKGEGLILDRITAVADYSEDDLEALVVSGVIINLGQDTAGVPKIVYQLKTADGSLYDAWMLDPPAAQLAPQEEVRFQTRYPDLAASIKEVIVRLVPEFI